MVLAILFVFAAGLVTGDVVNTVNSPHADQWTQQHILQQPKK